MKAGQLIRDPVFQLNLLLWMAKEQPEQCYQVRPLFHQCGFSPLVIELPFKLPVVISQKIAAMPTLEISREPEPEVILGNQLKKKAVYFECKASSFGPESSNSRQARGHLLASGPIFGEVFGPLDNCVRSYVVPDTDREKMRSCLTDLRQNLLSSGLWPGQFSVQGLKAGDKSILFTWEERFSEHLEIAQDMGREVQVLGNITPETDPSPLMLVYTDEDCPNQESRNHYRRILSERLRASMLCDINQRAEANEITLSADELLRSTTGGMFQYLGRDRQKRLRTFVGTNVFNFIIAEWEKKVPAFAALEGQAIRLAWTPGNRTAFLEWLEDRKTIFPAERITEIQASFFDADNE